MSVALTGNTGAELQSLEPNPDIVFASQLGQPEKPKKEEQGAGLATTLHIVRSEPVWCAAVTSPCE